ncbi:MAG TPA: hypothetical protein VEN81_00945 [Planctomycetota bacterium]|nr:hypothetical protein [Planctomycetota bacterium]
MDRKRKAVVWLLGIFVGGILSAWLTIAGIEARTARWLARDVRPAPFFYVKDTSPWTLKVWRGTGANFIPYEASPTTPERFPWRQYRPGEVILPFLARVEYGWAQEGDLGGGGHIWFFCLFGLSLRLGTTELWSA